MRCRSEYEHSNRKAAAIILAHPENHGGEESLLVRWARAVLTLAATASERKTQGSLFEAEAL
jgi:hypothetical protein